MSDVQFNEDRQDLYSFQSRSVLSESATPGMVRWLMGKGIVKNEKAADMVLIAVVVISFSASVYFFFFA